MNQNEEHARQHAQIEARMSAVEKRLAAGDDMLRDIHRAIRGPADGTEPGMAEDIRSLKRNMTLPDGRPLNGVVVELARRDARRQETEKWIGGVLALVLATGLVGLGHLAIRAWAFFMHRGG